MGNPTDLELGDVCDPAPAAPRRRRVINRIDSEDSNGMCGGWYELCCCGRENACMQRCATNDGACTIIWLLAVCAVFFLMIPLIVKGFSDVGLREAGLEKDVIDGTVDTKTMAVGNGRYWTGVSTGYETFFIGYNRDCIRETVSSNVTLTVRVCVFWKLQKDGIGPMYERYRRTYPAHILSLINGAVKTAAQATDVEDYKEHPESIRTLFNGAIQNAFTGDENDLILIDFDPSYTTLESELPSIITERDIQALLARLESQRVDAQGRLDVFIREQEGRVEDIDSDVRRLESENGLEVVRITETARAEGQRITGVAIGEAVADVFAATNATTDDERRTVIEYFVRIGALGSD